MLLSIDVGIKSLALCNLELKTGKILHWNVINLVSECSPCALCHLKATYQMVDLSLCTRHAKKSVFPISSACFEQCREKRRVSKAKVAAIANANMVDVEDTSLESVFSFILANRLTRIKEQSAAAISLPIIAKSLNQHLGMLSWIPGVSTAIVENQIGPRAIRMKAVQALITQYLVDVGITDIVYQSSRNKLQDYEVPQKTYKERKNSSVAVTRNLLADQEGEWRRVFETARKKDDLADAFLQAVWYRRHCS